MNNLCLITTGQIRTFFRNKNADSYTSMIELCKQHYSIILIVAVVNGVFDSYTLSEYLLSLGVKFLIIDYNTYKSQYNTEIELKLKSNEYLTLKQKYQQNKNNSALHEIPEPDSNPNLWIQFHQLYVGISHMLEYEMLHKVNFDMIMKTRFDIRYKPSFFPYMPKDTWNKFCFNEELITEFSSTIEKLGIEMDINSVLHYLKTQKIEAPNCRVNNIHLPISFGGMYVYNTISLQNIINGSTDILYAFNDFIFFSKREVFLKLTNLFHDSGIKDSVVFVPHFYAQEAQFYIFCINNGIDILMFTQLNPNGHGYAYGPS